MRRQICDLPVDRQPFPRPQLFGDEIVTSLLFLRYRASQSVLFGQLQRDRRIVRAILAGQHDSREGKSAMFPAVDRSRLCLKNPKKKEGDADASCPRRRASVLLNRCLDFCENPTDYRGRTCLAA